MIEISYQEMCAVTTLVSSTGDRKKDAGKSNFSVFGEKNYEKDDGRILKEAPV